MDELAYLKAIAAYLKDKIERGASFYEMRAGQLPPAYLERIAWLAKRTKDPLLADHFRKSMQPGRIVSAVGNIRRQLKAGEFIEADKALEALGENLAEVERRSTYPFFQTGAKQRQHLDSGRAQGNAKRKRAAGRKHRQWAAEAQNAWKANPGFSVARCARYLIKKLNLKEKQKTIEDVIRNFHPKKVGDAG
jgi:hypothetical protein